MAVDGVKHVIDFLPETEAIALFWAVLSSATWHARMRARKTSSFGMPYDYSGQSYPPTDWPRWLAPVRGSVEAQVHHPMTNCLANFYVDGHSSMGFHADSYERLRPDSVIAIVSLGLPRTLRFRLNADRAQVVDYRLWGGSLLLMQPSVQREWKHAVPPEATPADAGPRVSLTFRCVID